jgi:hypothetical protein
LRADQVGPEAFFDAAGFAITDLNDLGFQIAVGKNPATNVAVGQGTDQARFFVDDEDDFLFGLGGGDEKRLYLIIHDEGLAQCWQVRMFGHRKIWKRSYGRS